MSRKQAKGKEKRNLKTALLWHAWEASTYACAGEANRKIWRIKLRVYIIQIHFFNISSATHIWLDWIHTYIYLAWCEIDQSPQINFICYRGSSTEERGCPLNKESVFLADIHSRLALTYSPSHTLYTRWVEYLDITLILG